MTVMLATLLLVVSVAGVWSTWRRRALLAWNRELEAAFGRGERREIRLHRTL